jgi:hypothetical protein
MYPRGRMQRCFLMHTMRRTYKVANYGMCDFIEVECDELILLIPKRRE